MQVWGSVEGQAVHRAVIGDGAGSEAAIIGWGAAIQRLQIKGQDVVLGLNSLEDYRQYSPFFGAIAGRVANRIALGQLPLPDRVVQLPLNEGAHHLHGGGPRGVGKRVWQLDEVRADSVRLRLTITEADDGYPGDAALEARFAFVAPGCLRLTLTAQVTELGPINLAHHSYFNLSGGADILDHQIQIDAARYIVTDAAAIPLHSASVEGSPYDFRSPRTPHWQGLPLAVDNNFCLGGSGLRAIAQVRHPDSGRLLRVISDQPDVQLYCGHKVAVPVAGLGGRRYGPFAGLCLEPQIRPGFLRDGYAPNGLVAPGQDYRQVLELQFEGF